MWSRCLVCEFFGLMVRLQSEIGSLVLLLQKIPEGFNLVEEKGSGLAMHVQNDACFHARQGLQHRIVQIK